MTLAPKQIAASEALKRRKAQSGAQRATPACVVKVDRLQGYCLRNPRSVLQGIPGFRSVSAYRINRPQDGRFQAYGYAHWFESTNSKMKFLLESHRREAWLRPYRMTLYADDRSGLLPEEVFGVLEVLPDFKLTMLELAFDFDPDDMNRAFVREHALFGSSRPRPSINGTDYWGTRCGSKRVQIYEKEIDGA